MRASGPRKRATTKDACGTWTGHAGRESHKDNSKESVDVQQSQLKITMNLSLERNLDVEVEIEAEAKRIALALAALLVVVGGLASDAAERARDAVDDSAGRLADAVKADVVHAAALLTLGNLLVALLLRLRPRRLLLLTAALPRPLALRLRRRLRLLLRLRARVVLRVVALVVLQGSLFVGAAAGRRHCCFLEVTKGCRVSRWYDKCKLKFDDWKDEGIERPFSTVRSGTIYKKSQGLVPKQDPVPRLTPMTMVTIRIRHSTYTRRVRPRLP